MIKKRMVGVITVKDSLAVQSFGYKTYLPLGKPAVLAENLDRWGADEILLNCIDVSSQSKSIDLNLITSVSKAISTPLIYSGGVQSPEDAVSVVKAGADRICLDAIVSKDIHMAVEISKTLGRQAIILTAPFTRSHQDHFWLDHIGCKLNSINDLIKTIEMDIFSELMLVDSDNEGIRNSFDMSIMDKIIPLTPIPLILFGGISSASQIKKIFNIKNVSAVGIGNSLSYKELAIKELKSSLPKEWFRS
jgi:imidazole glycerol-phosphate synthase subunit HisF